MAEVVEVEVDLAGVQTKEDEVEAIYAATSRRREEEEAQKKKQMLSGLKLPSQMMEAIIKGSLTTKEKRIVLDLDDEKKEEEVAINLMTGNRILFDTGRTKKGKKSRKKRERARILTPEEEYEETAIVTHAQTAVRGLVDRRVALEEEEVRPLREAEAEQRRKQLQAQASTAKLKKREIMSQMSQMSQGEVDEVGSSGNKMQRRKSGATLSEMGMGSDVDGALASTPDIVGSHSAKRTTPKRKVARRMSDHELYASAVNAVKSISDDVKQWAVAASSFVLPGMSSHETPITINEWLSSGQEIDGVKEKREGGHSVSQKPVRRPKQKSKTSRPGGKPPPFQEIEEAPTPLDHGRTRYVATRLGKLTGKPRVMLRGHTTNGRVRIPRIKKPEIECECALPRLHSSIFVRSSYQDKALHKLKSVCDDHRLNTARSLPDSLPRTAQEMEGTRLRFQDEVAVKAAGLTGSLPHPRPVVGRYNTTAPMTDRPKAKKKYPKINDRAVTVGWGSASASPRMPNEVNYFNMPDRERKAIIKEQQVRQISGRRLRRQSSVFEEDRFKKFLMTPEQMEALSPLPPKDPKPKSKREQRANRAARLEKEAKKAVEELEKEKEGVKTKEEPKQQEEVKVERNVTSTTETRERRSSERSQQQISRLPKKNRRGSAVSLLRRMSQTDFLENEAAWGSIEVPETLKKARQALCQGFEQQNAHSYKGAVETYSNLLSSDALKSNEPLAKSLLCAAYKHRSEAYTGLKKHVEALEDSIAAKNTAPDSVSSRVQYCICLMNTEKFKEATSAYLEGLALDPGNHILVEGYKSALSALRRARLYQKKLKQPEIHSLFPKTGSFLGDTGITITGAFLGSFQNPDDTRVFVGKNECHGVTVISGEKILCTTPPATGYHRLGAMQVYVSVNNVISKVNGRAKFVYSPPEIELVQQVGSFNEDNGYELSVEVSGKFFGKDPSLIRFEVDDVKGHDIQLIVSQKKFSAKVKGLEAGLHMGRVYVDDVECEIDFQFVVNLIGAREEAPKYSYRRMKLYGEHSLRLEIDNLLKFSEDPTEDKIRIQSRILRELPVLREIHRYYSIDERTGYEAARVICEVNSRQFRTFCEDVGIMGGNVIGPDILPATVHNCFLLQVRKENEAEAAQGVQTEEGHDQALSVDGWINAVLNVCHMKYNTKETGVMNVVNQALDHMKMAKRIEPQNQFLAMYTSVPVQRVVHKVEKRAKEVFAAVSAQEQPDGTIKDSIQTRFCTSIDEFLGFLKQRGLIDKGDLNVATARKAFNRANIGDWIMSTCDCVGVCECTDEKIKEAGFKRLTEKAQARKFKNEIHGAEAFTELSFSEFMEALARCSVMRGGYDINDLQKIEHDGMKIHDLLENFYIMCFYPEKTRLEGHEDTALIAKRDKELIAILQQNEELKVGADVRRAVRLIQSAYRGHSVRKVVQSLLEERDNAMRAHLDRITSKEEDDDPQAQSHW